MTEIKALGDVVRAMSLKRDAKVRQWRSLKPPKSQRWIAKKLNISQQRVDQICKRINEKCAA